VGSRDERETLHLQRNMAPGSEWWMVGEWIVFPKQDGLNAISRSPIVERMTRPSGTGAQRVRLNLLLSQILQENR